MNSDDEARIILSSIDRLVHEPVRMALLSVLDGVAEADFSFLRRTLQLTQGNLSAHLAKLEAGGLVMVTKSFHGRTPRTTVAITPVGRDARVRHWQQLDALRSLAGPGIGYESGTPPISGHS